MGGTESKNISKSINDVCIESITSSIMTCTTSSTQNQMLKFSNVKGNISINSSDLSQGVSIDLSCVLSTSKTSEIANNLSTIIGQAAMATGSGIPSSDKTSSISESELNNHIKNRLENISKSDINTIISQQQSFIVDNVTGDINMSNVTMSQQATIIAKAILTSTDVSNIITQIQDKVSQTTKSETKNPISTIISSVGSALSNMITSLFGSGFTFIAIAVVIVGGIGLYMYLSKNTNLINSVVGKPSLSNTTQVFNHPQYIPQYYAN